MLTCEQIAERTRAFGITINRTTYHEIAQQIHPKIKKPTQLVTDHDTPEWREHQRGQTWRTDDWTDMVVSAVARWQWYASVLAAPVGEGQE